MKKTITTTNKVLELEQLEALLLRICNTINMPIRKSQLIRFIKDFFEYSNTVKQINFALISLIEKKQLIQHTYFICSPELAEEKILTPTITEEYIVKFLLSEALKEEIKHDIFFDVNSKEKITPSTYFKYLSMKHPTLISRNKALALLEQLENIFSEEPYLLQNHFYIELNEFPNVEGLICSLFNDMDSRIIIKSIRANKSYIFIKYMLVPSRKGSYSKSYQNSTELDEKFKFYLHDNLFASFKSQPIVMVIGNQKTKKKKSYNN